MAVKARAEITLSSIRDIQSVTRYYLLQSSTAAAPTKPTTNPPGGDWVKAEPTYTTGSTNSLYFTDCTVFSDDTFVYSDVSLSSSYEAAKVAYNKAAGAEDVANSANEKIDNLEVGGRNLYIVKDARNGYINFSNGGVSGMNATNREQISDFIPVAEGEKLVFQAWAVTTETGSKTGSAWLGYAFYNSEKTYLGSRPSKYDGTVQADGYTYNFYKITVPANAAFIRCSYRRVTDGKAKLERGTLATGWTPAPEDLEAEVNAAQETANGKNTVYYQAEAPSGGTYKTNDIWFDTDNGNKMYMWNGSAWTPEQFGNAAISDLSITNAKIANGTIESAKISNLDAGKVTSGTMSAARIKGDELKLGGDNNTDGVMKVYDADGNLVGSFTKEGLMAIAGTIAGWTIGEDALTGTSEVGTEYWETRLSKDGLRFKEYPKGSDPLVDWTREIYYNHGLVRYSSQVNGESYSGVLENRPGEDGLRIYPKVTVGDPLDSTETVITNDDVDTSIMRLKELWARPLFGGSAFYVRQPAMIMSGKTTISGGTTQKRATICSIPTEYQSGWLIVPFVTRTYGNSGVAPADNGDFYYAYYNSADHNVCIKLANVLPSGVNFTFDYFIYALPIT